MIEIKICGVTRPEDAAGAVRAGASFVGLNFWPQSKRHVTLERAVELAAAIRDAGAAKVVGVFVNADAATIGSVVKEVGLDVVQLHGDETPDDAGRIGLATGKPVWKAIAARSLADVDRLGDWPTASELLQRGGVTGRWALLEPSVVDALLLDTPTPDRGGSGQTFDWAIATAAVQRDTSQRIVLAGGLRPENVRSAVTAVWPWAVDVASGVESAPGIKDADQMAAFVAAARSAYDPRP